MMVDIRIVVFWGYGSLLDRSFCRKYVAENPVKTTSIIIREYYSDFKHTKRKSGQPGEQSPGHTLQIGTETGVLFTLLLLKAANVVHCINML